MPASPPSRCRAALLSAVLLFPTGLTAEPVNEEFHYRWRLTNFLGRVAGLFLPSRGEGVLSHRSQGGELLVSQLEITSTKSEDGDYWLYGAEIDLQETQTVRAWSSYRFRGKKKSRNNAVEDDGVVDIASGILQIRRSPPDRATPLKIWSDGKVYAVQVVPKGLTTLRLGEKRVRTQRFVVRGSKGPGRPWKGKIELWLQEDEAATPAAILIHRKGMGVLLELNQE